MNTLDDKRFALSVSSLSKLLESLGYPNPEDDDGPWGPIGPVSKNFSWVALNPQPLPPKWMEQVVGRMGPFPQPWREEPDPLPWRGKAGPTPNPWMATMIARLTIDRIVGMAQFAEGMGGESFARTARGTISDFVDDWCGTPPRPRWPLPWPFPLRLNDDMKIQPADLIVMGIQFHRAAEAMAGSPLAADLADAGNRLAQTGLERIG